MQRRAGRDGELEAAGAARALVEPRSGPLPVLPAHQGDGAAIAAGRTNPPVWPDHGFEQRPAMVLVLEGFDHVWHSGDPRQHLAYRQIHRDLLIRSSVTGSE